MGMYFLIIRRLIPLSCNKLFTVWYSSIFCATLPQSILVSSKSSTNVFKTCSSFSILGAATKLLSSFSIDKFSDSNLTMSLSKVEISLRNS